MPDQLPDKNKTGVSSNPKMAKAMRDAVAEFPPTSTGTRHGDEAVRIGYAREVEPGSLGYGSVPGPEPKLLSDKLGERLAFERSGVRLYETLISKLEAFGGYQGGPTRADLLQILNEEHCHASLVHDAILELGGDPTAVTPAADLVGVIAGGVVQVVTDPRTTLVQCLEAILVAELADNAGWELLIAIARKAGKNELAKSFELAKQTEEQHRAKIEAWLAAALRRQ
ncbi:MAG TPA: ferritin-like domain-containing protein [Enhygromyxa sp.]|nr:ferritin-like domain-containing protein [Enhygromyxa sp.]